MATIQNRADNELQAESVRVVDQALPGNIIVNTGNLAIDSITNVARQIAYDSQTITIPDNTDLAFAETIVSTNPTGLSFTSPAIDVSSNRMIIFGFSLYSESTHLGTIAAKLAKNGTPFGQSFFIPMPDLITGIGRKASVSFSTAVLIDALEDAVFSIAITLQNCIGSSFRWEAGSVFFVDNVFIQMLTCKR